MVFAAGAACLLPLTPVAVGAAPAISAAEFRSVAEAGATLFDAPSARAKKLFIARRYYPLEVVVNLEQWCKVRDAANDIAWVEKRALSDVRMVMVTAPRAVVRAAPDAAAQAVFAADKDVALEVIELTGPEWVRVRHADGQSGYVRASEVWGL